jgi:hypothetical protein
MNRVSPNILVNVYALDIFDTLYYIYMCVCMCVCVCVCVCVCIYIYTRCLVAYIVHEIHIIVIDYDTF